ncbi:MAG: hypothetical protein PHV78_02660 [Patescibacteria group bacterium]|nr:hypothetical protein [Patescibacteria group bacterium]MDD5121709.1 hypothetical protein [Patescibacteria group bacterium]MDD5221704.1 hypothetical protein [Patescibacteria group bacterium]MDD5396127.1 hypothetical protein [Patescibacteria group bacterium]
MKKLVVIIALLILSLSSARDVFAVATPITQTIWTANFTSKNYVNTSKTTTYWQSGFYSLPTSNGQYINSAILQTNDISFNQDILRLTISNISSLPAGTSIIPYVSFDQNVVQHTLSWGQAFAPTNRTRKLHLTLYFATNDVLVTPKLYTIYLQVEMQDRSPSGAASRDSKRISNLKSMVNIVERYHKDFQVYPIVNVDKDEKTVQWASLRSILDSATSNGYKKYNSGFIAEPQGVDSEYQYGYLTDSGGYNYLFWTQLEDSANSKNAWLGTAFDVVCSPPIFCLSSTKVTSISEGGNSSNNSFPSPYVPIVPLPEENNQNQNTTNMPSESENNQNIFLRQVGDSRVWLFINDRVVWLRTPQVFQRLGGDWNDILPIKNLNSRKLLKFVKSQSSPMVYLINSGFKRPMLNLQMLGFYGKTNEIVTISDDLINALPDDTLIRAVGDDKVYLFDQGIKRWITTPEAMVNNNFNFNDIIQVNPAELNYYPDGNPIF